MPRIEADKSSAGAAQFLAQPAKNARFGDPHAVSTRRVAEDLIAHGSVRRAILGAEGRTIWPELAEALHLGVEQGILVERVMPGGPAAQAGIRGGNRSVHVGLQEMSIGGDVLIAIDGKAVTSQVDLNLLLNRAEPGDTVKLTIMRDGKKMDVPVKLGGT